MVYICTFENNSFQFYVLPHLFKKKFVLHMSQDLFHMFQTPPFFILKNVSVIYNLIYIDSWYYAYFSNDTVKYHLSDFYHILKLTYTIETLLQNQQFQSYSVFTHSLETLELKDVTQYLHFLLKQQHRVSSIQLWSAILQQQCCFVT